MKIETCRVSTQKFVGARPANGIDDASVVGVAGSDQQVFAHGAAEQLGILADEALASARPAAVLVESGVTLRKGNGEGFEAAFAETLGPGVECTVLSERPGWVQLQLPDGRTGWARDSQVQRV